VHVNRAIQQADLIIGVGLRFDDRVTGNLAAFARGARVIHLELDPSEVVKRYVELVEAETTELVNFVPPDIVERMSKSMPAR